jgi:ATP-dependent RNA helicase RhlE
LSFTSLGLSEALSHSLAGLGYALPTPVQAKSIPIVLSGCDLLARAQTGTGKTAAFGLPMIDRLLVRSRRSSIPRTPRGLVLVPTRELAVQVHQALETYGAAVKVRATAIFGGVGMRPQLDALRRGVDIVVATPGRLIDHMERRTIDLSGVEILTLDEADRMLDMGFLPPLRRVLEMVPRARQTLLFSATLSPDVRRLAAEFTREPVDVDVSQEQIVAPTVTHHLRTVDEGAKGDALADVLTQEPACQALVFCKTKRRSDRVGRHLAGAGIAAAVIHGNKSQAARARALGDFKVGRVKVLVATDLAARGLDIDQLPLVVNYDLPLVAEDYVHRVGRTGRAGRAGRAVSLVSPADQALLPAIQRLLPAPIQRLVSSQAARVPSRHPLVRPVAPPPGRRRPRVNNAGFRGTTRQGSDWRDSERHTHRRPTDNRATDVIR